MKLKSNRTEPTFAHELQQEALALAERECAALGEELLGHSRQEVAREQLDEVERGVDHRDAGEYALHVFI